MYESPELRRLFSTYSDSKAPGRDSIADHLSLLSMAEHRDDTLIVATATDLAVFPGGGAPPQVQGFRVNIPGFTELTAISHFGPAIASIVAISMRGEDELWRRDAQRLIDDTRRVRSRQRHATLAGIARDHRLRGPRGTHRSDGRLRVRDLGALSRARTRGARVPEPGDPARRSARRSVDRPARSR